MQSSSAESIAPRLMVIGSGAWGTTLAMVAHRAGTPTVLVARDEATADSLRRHRRHPRSLEGIDLTPEVNVITDWREDIATVDAVILAIPTQKQRSALADLAPALRGKIVVTAAKGIEVGTMLLPTETIEDVTGLHDDTPICALSGPNLAGEVARGLPSTTVIASRHEEAARHVQNLLMGETFRVYTSSDVVGVQMGGALKNIIAIGAGIGDGLGAGDNAKAAFMTRGIAEIARLGVARGAEPLTFAGLSGIGDLITTCSSDLSRNHTVGVGLSTGDSLETVLSRMSEVAEGVETTRAAVELAKAAGVNMPIAEEMARILFEGKSPLDALRALMMREARSEDTRN